MRGRPRWSSAPKRAPPRGQLRFVASTLTVRVLVDTMDALASVRRDQGRHEEAAELYERALAGQEKTLGPEHESTLLTVGNLAGLHRQQPAVCRPAGTAAR